MSYLPTTYVLPQPPSSRLFKEFLKSYLTTVTYKCLVCNRVFHKWAGFWQHTNAVGHWRCETCYEQFGSVSTLYDHMAEHDHFRRPYECEGCDSTFGTIEKAKDHMDKKDYWRDHRCQPCDLGFETKQKLKKVSDASPIE